MNALDTVWTALQALPRPVDLETAKQAGMAASGAKAQQFGEWFDINGPSVVEKLNSLN